MKLYFITEHVHLESILTYGVFTSIRSAETLSRKTVLFIKHFGTLVSKSSFTEKDHSNNALNDEMSSFSSSIKIKNDAFIAASTVRV